MFSDKTIFSRFDSAKAYSSFSFAPSLGAGILIFAAVFFYGGEGVLAEAWLAAAIFALAAKSLGEGEFVLDKNFFKLIAPVLALSVFSFLQGALTLYAPGANFENRLALFYSFDPAASLRCAVKFFALAVFLIFLRVKFRGSIKPLVWTLVLIGDFFAAFALLRFFLQNAAPDFFGWFPLPGLRPNTGFGTFINQNHFAFLMLMNLGLNGGLLLFGNLSKPLRVSLAAAAFMTWTAIVLTASRGGIISSCFVITALAASFLFIRLKKKRAARGSGSGSGSGGDNQFGWKFNFGVVKSASVIVGLIAALIFGIALVGRERVAQRFEEIPFELTGASDTNGFLRIDVWRASGRMIREYPLTGVGFGGFSRAVTGYIDTSGAITPEAAHNDYLDFIASGGALALLLAVWMTVVFFGILQRRSSASLNTFERSSRTGIIAALTGIAAHGFFDYGLQYAGNWLYCAALIAIVSHEENAAKSAEDIEKFIRIGGKKRFVGAAIFSVLSLLCLWFGAARYSNSVVRTNENKLYYAPEVFKIPFDADYYETLAVIDKRAGNFTAETENLRQAIRRRPEDYALRLKTAAAAQRAGNFTVAENELRQATRLAPLYGEPHFELGNFLLRRDRVGEGISELRYAATRRPAYFSKIVEILWRITDGETARVLKFLEPLNDFERDDFVEFLYEKNQFAAIGDVLCAAENFDDHKRDKVIQKLFEKRQFSSAARIYRRDCKMKAESASPLLIDGDFEAAELRENLGFGWRAGNLPETLQIGFADDETASGKNSLAVIFGGGADFSLSLVSQLLPVEKNRRYQISFAARAEKITSGGLPVVNLILKKTDADAIAGEIRLTDGKEPKWTRKNIVVKTDASTEALEIRLTRKSCGESFCPIFGRLWLDDFQIRAID